MALTVSYRLVDQWAAGFNASVGITAGDVALNGWTIAFDAGFEITQIWNAEILSRSGTTYVIRNLDWNGTVAANGTVTFGFLGGSVTDPVPDAFTVNGALVSDLPSVSLADASVVEGHDGVKYLRFVATLSEAAAAPVAIDFATANGTALAGSDYVARNGTLTFAAGETRKVITVAVKGDTVIEATETMRLTLTAARGATIADGEAQGRIVDDDTPPAVRINDVVVTEGDAGTSLATFTVRLSKAWTSAVTMDYATVAGTAKAGSDYIAAAGSLSFAAGEVVKTVSVAIIGDRTPEAQEAFTLELGNVAGATVADGIGRATIRDTDKLPTIGVADTTVAEGDAGLTNAVFALTLDKAWHEAVTVSYVTRNGTAVIGEDYAGRSGTVTFAAGETSKTVAVPVKGDTRIEGDETFSLVIHKPVGATIRDNTGIATIIDNDAPAATPGFLSTAGNQIVDADGHAVRITGVNWFGMEDGTYAPHGLWARNWAEMMDEMAGLGFNTIRLPFSLEALQPGKVPNGIDFSKNPDLAGLSAIQILDKIVDHAGEIGMKIILDNHRSAAGAGPNGNGLWVDGGYTEQQWIDTWTMLAGRYAGDPTVIGADLANEPHNGVWGGGGANDWTAAAERAGNAIHAVNDDWLIFVEGVGTYNGSSTWWGGNLKGVEFDPVVLNTPNKLVYSPHEYGNSIYAQSWFSDPAYPNNLPQHFDDFWGYIYREGIAPVMLGEFGSKLQDPKDLPFLQKLLAYLDGDFDANGSIDIAADEEGMSFTWWSWNPNSGDTGGILNDDWTTPIEAKIALLEPHLSDLWAG
jgi:aryl-phospho-beta-D-glucosidase BglC (GH1 family)